MPSGLFSRGRGSRPVGITFTMVLTSATPTMATSARMIGSFETPRPSAICSGMLAPAMSRTTATKKKNLRYRNRPMITATASTATSVCRFTPSVSSTYSCGRLASTAVMVMRPISTSSRMRMRVRKSSFSFFAATVFPPSGRAIIESQSTDVEGLCQGRKRRARGRRARAPFKRWKKLHHERRLRAPQGRAQAARRSRAPGSREDGGVGGFARRSLGERRLYLRQETAARDRPARALSHQAPGGGGGRRLVRPRHRSGLPWRHRDGGEHLRWASGPPRGRGRSRCRTWAGVVGVADRQGPDQGARGRQRHAAHPVRRRKARNPRGQIPMSLLREFREFAVKGNVVDLAVAVIIGGAFGKIVSSLVEDIVMPAVGAAMGGFDFKSLMIEMGAAKITYGKVLQSCIDFVIIALAIFFAVKLIHPLRRKDEDKPPPAPPPRQEKLLEEIRDLLKQK